MCLVYQHATQKPKAWASFQNHHVHGSVLSVPSGSPSTLPLLQMGPWNPENQNEDPTAFPGNTQTFLKLHLY